MTDGQREELLDSWEQVAVGWARQADRFADALAPVSDAMLAAATFKPGVRVLELAAGPGDLSLLAAPRIAPTTVLCTDGVEAMVQVARDRAQEAQVLNIAFQRTQLEWIDLPAGSVDVILCRFGLMLTVDPEAALRECRRVLAPGGRIVLAVQGPAELNPWMTAPVRAAVELGFIAAAAPEGPGPFALAADGRLLDLMRDAGFLDVSLRAVAFLWRYRDEADWIGEKIDHSLAFAGVWRGLADHDRTALRSRLRALAEANVLPDGELAVPGLALVAEGDA